MNVAPIIANGWKFEIADSKLSITSEQNNNLHMQLSAKAAFSLLDYLYHERDELAAAAQEETTEESHDNSDLWTTSPLTGRNPWGIFWLRSTLAISYY